MLTIRYNGVFTSNFNVIKITQNTCGLNEHFGITHDTNHVTSLYSNIPAVYSQKCFSKSPRIYGKGLLLIYCIIKNLKSAFRFSYKISIIWNFSVQHKGVVWHGAQLEKLTMGLTAPISHFFIFELQGKKRTASGLR